MHHAARAATAAGPSTLAAVLNPNGTTGKLVGYLAGINAGFAVDLAISDDDTFTGQTQALTSSTGTGRTLTFSGRIASGVMTGTVAELGLTFTANVDPANQDRIIELIQEVCREESVALVLVSHSEEVSRRFGRVEQLSRINRAMAPVRGPEF